MIVITIAHLMDAQPALERLASTPLPVKTAFQVAKLLRLARPEIQQFTEHRDALIRELGAERRHGAETLIEVTPANREAFIAKVQELAALEVTLPIDPVEIAALDGTSVSATDLLALDRFIV
jgi:hypothetical protein